VDHCGFGAYTLLSRAAKRHALQPLDSGVKETRYLCQEYGPA